MDSAILNYLIPCAAPEHRLTRVSMQPKTWFRAQITLIFAKNVIQPGLLTVKPV